MATTVISVHFIPFYTQKHSRRTSSRESHSSYQIFYLHLLPKAELIHNGRVLFGRLHTQSIFVLASLWLCHPAFTSHNTLYDHVYSLKCQINLYLCEILIRNYIRKNKTQQPVVAFLETRRYLGLT